jgi:hypothetical protein
MSDCASHETVALHAGTQLLTILSGVKPGEIFYPPINTLKLLRVISVGGFGPWQVEAHKDGLVAFVKEWSVAPVVQQITLFCRQGSRAPVLMMTAKKTKVPANGIALGAVIEDFPKADGAYFQTGPKQYRVGREFVSERVTDDQRIFSIQLTREFLSLLLDHGEIEVHVDVGRIPGFYYARVAVNPAGRKAIEIAVRNCF